MIHTRTLACTYRCQLSDHLLAAGLNSAIAMLADVQINTRFSVSQLRDNAIVGLSTHFQVIMLRNGSMSLMASGRSVRRASSVLLDMHHSSEVKEVIVAAGIKAIERSCCLSECSVCKRKYGSCVADGEEVGVHLGLCSANVDIQRTKFVMLDDESCDTNGAVLIQLSVTALFNSASPKFPPWKRRHV